MNEDSVHDTYMLALVWYAVVQVTPIIVVALDVWG
jgi:hypothetical protein